MTVGGRGDRTGTAGTMNAVPTGMEYECAATVVAQWQVGTTKNELILWHMANLMTVQVCVCGCGCLWVGGVRVGV
jgi:hypothetical protein